MMKSNSEMRQAARVALKHRWSTGALMTLVYVFVYYALSFALLYGVSREWGSLVAILLLLPLVWAYQVAFLEIKRGKWIEVSYIFEGFKDAKRIYSTSLLQFVYITLWALLFLIPGIIKNYSYAMTPYILKDDPAIANNRAIEKSMAMMQGHKMQLFLLDLSFIGWGILCILTLGMGIFWLAPYMWTSHAVFYEELKQKGVEQPNATL